MSALQQSSITRRIVLTNCVLQSNNQAGWLQAMSEHGEIKQGLTSHQTHYRSYWGRVFMGQSQPTVSKHWRKI